MYFLLQIRACDFRFMASVYVEFPVEWSVVFGLDEKEAPRPKTRCSQTLTFRSIICSPVCSRACSLLERSLPERWSPVCLPSERSLPEHLLGVQLLYWSSSYSSSMCWSSSYSSSPCLPVYWRCSLALRRKPFPTHSMSKVLKVQ